jgi:CRISPR/Cas system-associated protein Cas5 (RAMP superfamily)
MSFAYALIATGALCSAAAIYDVEKTFRKAEKILRNEAEKIPAEKRLQFFEDKIKNIKSRSLFCYVNRSILGKVSREYLDRDEYVDFLKELHGIDK